MADPLHHPIRLREARLVVSSVDRGVRPLVIPVEGTQAFIVAAAPAEAIDAVALMEQIKGEVQLALELEAELAAAALGDLAWADGLDDDGDGYGDDGL